MFFQIKGNYFSGNYHLATESGPHAADRFLKRSCPADLNTKLWNLPVDYNHLDKVIESANEGFRVWRKTSLENRIHALKRFQEKVMERKDEMARAIAMETGKPLWEAYTEAGAVIAKVDVTISDSLPRIEDKHYEEIMPNTKGHVIHKPIGPCLIIGPFNFPCHLANGQITAALISGNSIIFKPSEKTAYSAQILIDCFSEADFPSGVINLVQGDGETARRLLKEKTIKGVFFTGSKEVGIKILKTTHKDLGKMVALELGGKNSTIIHKDANLEFAMPELVKACFLTSGQRCISTALVPIHRSIMDEFVEKFHKIAKRIIVDHPIDYDEEPFMGPLIDQMAVDNYLNFIGMAKREGIEEIMRGKVLERRFPGHYVSPSIHVASAFTKESLFLTSELFGPNCTFVPYDEIEQAVEIANGTEYGLAASVFTTDDSVYKYCIDEIDSGQVNLNRSTVGASSKLPFGGIKNSGNYRPAAVCNIDHCVYQMASLEIVDATAENVDDIKGIKKEN